MEIVSVCLLLLLAISKVVLCYDFQSTLGHIKSKTSPEVQTKAVQDLIKRLTPEHAYKFSVKVDETIGPSGRDTFQIETLTNNTLKIVGTSGVAAATGFHHYLKYYCLAHVSWETTQLKIPENLPEVHLRKTSQDRFRYYQNVCTTSYSFVWWTWPQWEKHIDWMVLNSFNLVLATHGQEAIWSRVYKKLNMTQEEINEQFAGPAFLSWSRMGNIRGWGGPLSDSWHSSSLTLQTLIVNRMREFGIITILPAFSGHVPRAFKRLFPTANMTEVGTWNKFNSSYCCPYLLDPIDPLFHTTGTLFLEELIGQFGTDHVYSCDTFNEMKPFTTDLSYLNLIGKATYSVMVNVDPLAIWVMQSWLFVHELFYWTRDRAKALLTSVPKVSFVDGFLLCRLLQGWMFHSEQSYWGDERVRRYLTSVPLGKMIVLDLQSEQFPQYDRFQSYFGQPYIWCMLHNFGGTLGMYGSVDIINQRVYAARNTKGSTMIGTGLTPEGINQNYVIYDLMMETGWMSTSVNITQWFTSYATRRYGQYEPNADRAWKILATSLYNFKGVELIRGKYAINRSPRTRIATWYWYDTCDVYEAWDYLLEAADALGDNLGYRHDLVDVTRQVLQVTGDQIYNYLMYAFKNKEVESFRNSVDQFLQLLDDLEDILATNEAFLLGNWLNSAKAAASNEKDKILFEYNARNQITLWGPSGEIKDYASKQWSGVVSHVFKPRWELFLEQMNQSLAEHVPFKEAAVVARVFKEVEEPFTFDNSSFPVVPIGDTVEVAKKIYDRWFPKVHCRSERRTYPSDEDDISVSLNNQIN